jgi:hypothetical protein
MRLLRFLCALAIVCSSVPSLPAVAAPAYGQFVEGPIDAISVLFPVDKRETAARYEKDGVWSAWQTLVLEDEQDPLTRESNLFVLPHDVSRVEIRDADVTPHPIVVDSSPPSYQVAATTTVSKRILSREDWGADDTFLYRAPDPVPVSPPSSSSSSSSADPGGSGDNGATTPSRVDDCQMATVNYPDEFKVDRTVRKDADGNAYRWTRTYSPRVKLLVVHHTAVAVGGDDRSGAERIRALYAYHANNRGWGDIGYHYLLDEDGRIYEGRSGGKFVVGGHAYCNNVGTVGISLLGNFDVEKPTQAQAKSLQWLLQKLGEDYQIDLSANVTFHGKTMPTIVGHRDLLQTDCPGHSLYAGLSSIRRHAADGDTEASVNFPSPTAPRSSKSSSRRSAQGTPHGISALGETTLTGPPGSQIAVSLRYRGPARMMRKGASIGRITRSDTSIGVWQDLGAGYRRVRDQLTLSQPLPSNGSLALQVKFQLPSAEGTYSVRLGEATFTLIAKGKRTTVPRGTTVPANSLPRAPRSRSSASSAPSVRGRSSAGSASAVRLGRTKVRVGEDPDIRVRLAAAPQSLTIETPSEARANGSTAENANVFVFKDGNDCVASVGQNRIASGIVRLTAPEHSLFSLVLSPTKTLRYPGTIECRVVDGELAIINELPMETYLAGLSEEPDTEPYEKQRAFAIAARSYAVYYLSDDHRKFPDKPYDGSDDPAIFQKYSGRQFTEDNPSWAKAVESTRGLVLVAGGDVLRVAYFSASDGRTRSPAEIGWTTFPHPEVFASKPDPWCNGMTLRGHGVGMSGCGSEAQAEDGKTAEEILGYYYRGAELGRLL